MKKLTALICALLLMLSLAACSESAPTNPPAPAESADGTAPAETVDEAEKTYTVGICQLVQHPALDAATEGFKAALTEKLGDRVTFVEQNASGDAPTCAVICGQFVSDGVDLILANATPALQAAMSVTADIPILGTSVTDYATALDISDWSGVTGKNISGTSDLSPLDGQAEIIGELFPEAKTVGILFCSGEPNSRFQVDVITPMIEALGMSVKEYSFVDSNDIAAVTANACSECDVIYIPTDNTAASCTETINSIALNAGIPIVTGEEGLCSGCGVATLSFSYYDLGYTTGEMACEVLVDGADVSTMPVRSSAKFTKEYNADICAALGIAPPDGYVAIES